VVAQILVEQSGDVPQGLKLNVQCASSGTAEAVPFQNSFVTRTDEAVPFQSPAQASW
jgi:hypothetical protein